MNEADRVALREKIRAQRRAAGQQPYITGDRIQRVMAAVLESHRRRVEKLKDSRNA